MTSQQSGALRHVVVVGASLAGLRACETLRDRGLRRHGSRSSAPSARSPTTGRRCRRRCSPASGRSSASACASPTTFESLGLELRLGVRATALDTHARTCRSTTAPPSLRRPHPRHGRLAAPAARPARCSTASRAAHAGRLRSTCATASPSGTARVTCHRRRLHRARGGGHGSRRGCAVTVLEGAPSPLIRGLGVEMGAAVAGVHARNGVHLRCGVQVASLEGEAGRSPACDWATVRSSPVMWWWWASGSRPTPSGWWAAG
jgi:hypothetical protein